VRFLDVAMGRVGCLSGDPEVLLATLLGEQHVWVLLIAEALVIRAGRATRNLGTVAPLEKGPGAVFSDRNEFHSRLWFSCASAGLTAVHWQTTSYPARACSAAGHRFIDVIDTAESHLSQRLLGVGRTVAGPADDRDGGILEPIHDSRIPVTKVFFVMSIVIAPSETSVWRHSRGVRMSISVICPACAFAKASGADSVGPPSAPQPAAKSTVNRASVDVEMQCGLVMSLGG
jgi:hypothetical protein